MPIQKLEGREKIQPRLIANKLNEIIDILNKLEDSEQNGDGRTEEETT